MKFKFTIDSDVIKSYNIRNTVDIACDIGVYLNDPSGWSKHGYFFEPVNDHEDVHIRLCSPQTIQHICGVGENLSCAELGGKNMYLNADRWFHGASPSKLSLYDYRQYMVSHEIGHILGHNHKSCPCKGCKAPIMMQQTKGIGECTPNTAV